MILLADQLRRASGCSAPIAARFVSPINLALVRFGIDTPERIAAFLSQASHESARFTRLVENLNYSADGLARTWPNRYRGVDGKPNAAALAIARKPEFVANSVYSSRMGNGDTASGDGWRFRGRGIFQLTGRDGYRRCGEALGIDLLAKPESLELPLYAALSAGWYWSSNGLNAIADGGDVRALTKRINGGHTGLAERLALYESARLALV